MWIPLRLFIFTSTVYMSALFDITWVTFRFNWFPKVYQNPYYLHRGIRKLSFTHWRMKHFPKFVFFLVVSIILSEVCIRDSVLTFYLKKIEKCKGFHRKKNLIFQINRCRPYNYLELFLRFKWGIWNWKYLDDFSREIYIFSSIDSFIIVVFQS